MSRYSFPLIACVLAAGIAGAPAAYAASLAVNVQEAPQVGLVLRVAADTEGARAFVDGMAQRGIGFLGNQDLSEEGRAAEFRKLLNSSFDMATIGRFALGPNWKTATPAQQAEYQKLFREMIVRTYSRRFSDYKGQTLQVTGARADGNDVIVSSVIVPTSGDKVKVDWRVRNKGGYKVVDVIVEGVSMALTQRSDFSSVIQRGGGKLDVLLDHLRQM